MKKIFKNNTLIYLLFIFILLFMTTGYASLKQTLTISGNVQMNLPEFSVVTKSLALTSVEGSGVENSTPTYSGTEGAFYFYLPTIDSKVTYTFKIRNVGATQAILDYVFSTVSNENVQCKIGGLYGGEKLVQGDYAYITVEFSYWDGITEPFTDPISAMINLEFVPNNNGYSNECTLAWDGSTTSQPNVRNVYGIDYYEISNANEYAWYINYLNNSSNNVNAILTNNICLNSQALPQVDVFSGNLDGQNRTVNDYVLSINHSTNKGENYIYGGMFKDNSGTIQNLNINGALTETSYIKPNSTSKPKAYDYFGGIAAINNGKIVNSTFSGSINGSYEIITNCWVVTPVQRNYIGAIAGQNKGIIQGCANKGDINVGINSHRTACTYERETRINFGGITGSNLGYVSDSYNNAPLTITSDVKNGFHYLWYGGIIGDLESGRIQNSYNAGTVSHINNASSTDEYYYIGGALGLSSGTVTNTYYLDSCGQSGSIGKAVSAGDLQTLNLKIGTYYTTDAHNINNGYPILKWQ